MGENVRVRKLLTAVGIPTIAVILVGVGADFGAAMFGAAMSSVLGELTGGASLSFGGSEPIAFNFANTSRDSARI